MGSRGPAPAPTALLEKRGSWRAKLNKAEPQPTEGIPDKPIHLDDIASIIWDKFVDYVYGMGIASKPDELVVTRYAEAYSQWYKCVNFLRGKTVLTYPVKNEEGQIVGSKPFPEVAMADKLHDTLLRIEKEYGLTPSSRSRITTGKIIDVPQPKTKDKSRFFDRHAKNTN